MKNSNTNNYPDFGDHFMSQNNNYYDNYNPFQAQDTNVGASQNNTNFYLSQEIQMEEIINEGVRRSIAVYNLSETDNFNSYQEVDSEDLDSEELDGSDGAND